MEPRALSENSTIYHYTLAKKIPVRREFLFAYIGILIIFAIFISISVHMSHLISLMLSYIFIQVIHTAIIFVYFHFKNKTNLKIWRFQWSFPWSGFLASLPISIYRFKSIHMHLFFIGLAVVLFFFPWASSTFIFELLFIHCWILLPRFIVIALSVKAPKAELIMLSAKQITFYTS